jgi:hypothetical protein
MLHISGVNIESTPHSYRKRTSSSDQFHIKYDIKFNNFLLLFCHMIYSVLNGVYRSDKCHVLWLYL